jgi:hypothetical protein
MVHPREECFGGKSRVGSAVAYSEAPLWCRLLRQEILRLRAQDDQREPHDDGLPRHHAAQGGVWGSRGRCLMHGSSWRESLGSPLSLDLVLLPIGGGEIEVAALIGLGDMLRVKPPVATAQQRVTWRSPILR